MMQLKNNFVNLYRKKCYRRLSICGILICLMVYNYLTYITTYLTFLRPTVPRYLVVDTTGCKIRSLQLTNSKVRNYTTPISIITCNGISLLHTLHYNGNNYLELSMDEPEIRTHYEVTSLKELSCMYMEFTQTLDTAQLMYQRPHFFNPDISKPLKLRLGTYNLHVECTIGNVTVYKDVHFLIQPPKTKKLHASRIFQVEGKEPLSVMILGLDSISHMHFTRQMMETNKFLSGNPSFVEFWGYNKVGHESYASLLPLLNGLNETERTKRCRKRSGRCPFLWNRYKTAGYKTIFGEDSITYGLPTQYMVDIDLSLRPIITQMQLATAYKSNYPNVHCSGERCFPQVLWEFVYKVFPYLQEKPFFSYFWWTEGLRDYFNMPANLDKKYLQLFQILEETNVFNRTLILLMSANGFRRGGFYYTDQGMHEDALPLLKILYPKWMRTVYPAAISNLIQNSRSLVTTFDLHETLLDILNLNNLMTHNIIRRDQAIRNTMPRGISLFLAIPEQRTCEDAGIPTHFCLCNQFMILSNTDVQAKDAAEFILRHINKLLVSHPKCHQLKLSAILRCYEINSSSNDKDKVSKQSNTVPEKEFGLTNQTVTYLRLFIETFPGHAQFEATVRSTDSQSEILDTIARLDNQKNMANCIENPEIQKYCICR